VNIDMKASRRPNNGRLYIKTNVLSSRSLRVTHGAVNAARIGDDVVQVLNERV